jgi:hypothetical protein
MIKIKASIPYLLGLAAVIVVTNITTNRAVAQQVIIIDRADTNISQPPVVGNFIYGSPIPTPVPVDPSTGLMPTRSYYSYPNFKRDVRDSTLLNPVLVNPNIRDSTIINPVILNNRQFRRPLRQRSRVIIY